jgi:hypothetical protein
VSGRCKYLSSCNSGSACLCGAPRSAPQIPTCRGACSPMAEPSAINILLNSPCLSRTLRCATTTGGAGRGGTGMCRDRVKSIASRTTSSAAMFGAGV